MADTIDSEMNTSKPKKLSPIIIIIVILVLAIGGLLIYNYLNHKEILSIPFSNDTNKTIEDTNKTQEDFDINFPSDSNVTTPNNSSSSSGGGSGGSSGGSSGSSESSGGGGAGGGSPGDTSTGEETIIDDTIVDDNTSVDTNTEDIDTNTEDEDIDLDIPNPEWAFIKKLGGSDHETAGDFVIDSLGNTYITGSYYGNSVIGTTTLTGSGYHDMFVAKLDPSGNVLWATKAGGSRYDLGNAIAIDTTGNIYVAGIFNSPTINFENSSLSLTLSGTPSDIFIAKLDNSGNWLWVKKAGGTDLDDVSDIAVDDLSNIYITGFVRLDATFPPLSPISGETTEDVFVAKMNSSGDFLWVKRASGPDREYGSSIILDNENNIYISGNYNSASLSFGSITLQNTSEPAQYNSFIAKLDNSGNWLWVKQANGLHTEEINDIAIDNSNNLYVTGYFAGTVTFDSHTISSYGCINDVLPYTLECIQHDIFIAKIDNSGNWLWAKSSGGEADSEQGYGVAVDNQSIVYVTGKFVDTANFDNQATTSDIFIAKINSNTGEWISTQGIGSNGNDEGISVAIGSDNKEYYLGNFVETVIFGNTTLTSTGQTDIFIGKKI